jgi:hypothetical protein
VLDVGYLLFEIGSQKVLQISYGAKMTGNKQQDKDCKFKPKSQAIAFNERLIRRI